MSGYIENFDYECPILGDIEASGFIVEDSPEDVGHIEIDGIWIVERVDCGDCIKKIQRWLDIDILGLDYICTLQEKLYIELVRMRGEMH